jgi:hypothetical protein
VLLAVGAFSAFRLTGMTALEFCGDVARVNHVRGTAEIGAGSTFPTARPSVFPVGAECSYYAGPHNPRITSFVDFGTIPLILGIATFPASAILRIIERSRSSDESSA